MVCVNVSPALPGQTVDEIVHAELVRLVREIDRVHARVGVLPVFTQVVVAVGDRDHPLLRIVVFEDPPIRRLSVVRLEEVQVLLLQLLLPPLILSL